MFWKEFVKNYWTRIVVFRTTHLRIKILLSYIDAPCCYLYYWLIFYCNNNNKENYFIIWRTNMCIFYKIKKCFSKTQQYSLSTTTRAIIIFYPATRVKTLKKMSLFIVQQNCWNNIIVRLICKNVYWTVNL